jgi:hypothetical protein
VHQRVIGRPGFELSRPAGDEGYPNAALVGSVFGAAPGPVDLFSETAVVIGEDDQRIFREPVFVDRAQDAPHGFIEAFDGRFPFAQSIGVSRDFFQRTMDGVEGNVVKEGQVPGSRLEQADGFVGD